MRFLFIYFLFFTLLITPHIEAQELVVIQSSHLSCNDSIRIYSPNNEHSTINIPTLFLLHGWSGNYRNWGDKYNLQELSNKTKFRIITPDGFYNSWYLNNTAPEQMQWRDFFHRELYPTIQKKFGLDPNHTFITGLSMGGHGAINLFIDTPEHFRAAGSMSGVLDLQLTSLRDTELTKVIGTAVERIDSESAVNRIEKLTGLNKPMIVMCGYDDIYVKCTEVFSAKCREKKIPHVMILSPGKHAWQYWGYALEEQMNFFMRLLKDQDLGYSSVTK